MKKAVPFAIIAIFIFAFTRPTENPNKYTYKKDVQPIISMYCLQCHSGSSNSYMHPCNLNGYDSVKISVLNGTFRDRVLVKKDMPQSPLWQVGQHLSQEQLNVLDSWILAGTPLE
ncbi:MAG: hypothetical protein IT244_07965 [Bacteroidia bacterium]|nr:hypothetical protein [Bacteroidia bacterium]